MQLAHLLPFYEVDGDSGQSVTPQARSFSLGLLSTSRRICYGTQDSHMNVDEQSAVQIELGIRNLWESFFELFVSGNAAKPGEFAGLEAIVSGAEFAGQTLDAKGDVLSCGMIDSAQELVGESDDFKGVIYTNSRGLAEICRAVRAAGIHLQELPVEIPASEGGTKSVSMTHVNGWFVVPSESVPSEIFRGNTVTSIWFLKLGPGHVHGIIPDTAGRNIMIRVRSTDLPRKSAIRYDLTFPVGIAVTEVEDIAVIRNVLVR